MYQEEWENAYLTVKNTTTSKDPDLPAFRVMYLQTKQKEQIGLLIFSH